MKYMGSKRSMLRNGLGTLILEQAQHATRVVDPFCGTGSVAWFAAEHTDLPVLATDLQLYAVVLASAVISRTTAIHPEVLIENWLGRAQSACFGSDLWRIVEAFERRDDGSACFVHEARRLCCESSETGPVWNAYGGYYFSPRQALLIDYLIRILPPEEPLRAICLAATISAASRCAAAPGHTAQPFRPTGKGHQHIREAWKKDPIAVAAQFLRDVCQRYARVSGHAFVADAVDLAKTFTPTDLIIVDPPYSAVQYSRFYHVLETIARGEVTPVSGSGRYPPREKRPQSEFSKKTRAQEALRQLLTKIADAGSTVILTFPDKCCSNGLSGATVKSIAAEHFTIECHEVDGQFSTLGGNHLSRAPRQASRELILLLRPKRSASRWSVALGRDVFTRPLSAVSADHQMSEVGSQVRSRIDDRWSSGSRN